MFIILVFLQIALALAPQLKAQTAKLSLIRDTETELGIKMIIRPLLNVARLDPAAVKIFIVNNTSLNAFVAGGQNIFIHTGFLSNVKDVSELIGVLAHEIGHISGGHLSRLTIAQNDASTEALIGALLGGAATLLGRPDAGSALVLGGVHVGTRNILRFSRTQELSADRSALTYLELTGQSAIGLKRFLKLIKNQELLTINSQDPYVRTHPPNQQRISIVNRHIRRSKYSDTPNPKTFVEIYDFIQSKVFAFTERPSLTLSRYKKSNPLLSSKYARSIAYYRLPNFKKAIKIIDEILKQKPNNPYFNELKGQILFENGHTAEALHFYQKATSLLPKAGLIRSELARVQIETGEENLLAPAIFNLRRSLTEDPKRAFPWRLLGIALGKLGRIGESSHALAEEAIIMGKTRFAIRHAKKAKQNLSKNSPKWLRADDIEVIARETLSKQKNN